MDLKRFAKKAKDAIDERGGADGLKEDLGRARKAASTPGSVKDKATAVREALADKPGDDDAPLASEQSRGTVDAPPPTAG